MIEGDWIAERMLHQDDPFTDEYPGEVSRSEVNTNDDNDTSTKQLLGPEEVRSTDTNFAPPTRSSSRRPRNGVWIASVRSYCLIATLLAVLLILVIRRVVQNNNNDNRAIIVPTLAPTLVQAENIDDRSNSPSAAPSESPTINITQVPTADIDIPNNSTEPSLSPSELPSDLPSPSLSAESSQIPTRTFPQSETNQPTMSELQPSSSPSTTGSSQLSSLVPSIETTNDPNNSSTSFPTGSSSPSSAPSLLPTTAPSFLPTPLPTFSPSGTPSLSPTGVPSSSPTDTPTALPSSPPSALPTVGELWGQSSYIAQSHGDFGRSVAIHGNTMAVGMPGFDSVVIFGRNGTHWNLQSVVQADSVPENFGIDVAFDEGTETLVVGANEDGEGSVYVFVRSFNQSGVQSWIRQAKLKPHDGEKDDYFGTKVAISSDTIIVGSPLDDNLGGTDAGSAYIFVRSANMFAAGPLWYQQAMLTANDGAFRDVFGLAVAIDRDTAVVGARLKDGSDEIDAGSAYVFVRLSGTWTQEAQLTAGNAEGFQAVFGSSVDVSNNVIAIGSPYVSYNVSEAGRVFVFERSDSGTWIEEDVLSVVGGENNFGDTLSLQGNGLVVGSSSGKAAFVYRRLDEGASTSWILEAQLAASDETNDYRFGYRVALHGQLVVVTSYNYAQGSLYVYERNNWASPAPIPELFPPNCTSQVSSSVCKSDLDCCSETCVKQCSADNCAFGICA